MPTDVTAPAALDAVECRQGSPFHYILRFYEDQAGTTPSDLTGWQFRAQIREGVAGSNAPIIKDLSSEGSDPGIRFIAVNSADEPDINGTPDATNGFLYFYMGSAETALLKTQKAPKPRNFPVVLAFYWDVEGLPPGGEWQALAASEFNVTCEITRGE